MNCNDAVTALVASLERGEPMTAEQRGHIHTCTRCHELLDSVKQFQSLLAGNGIEAPSVDGTLAKAEEELRQARWRRRIWISVGAGALACIGVTALFALYLMRIDLGIPKLLVAAIGVFVFYAIGLVVAVMVRRANERGRRLYKRLRPGRVLAGVCLGLAEATGANVTLLRLAAFVLSLVDGIGLWLYVILYLVMPVHPDDRQYLLRFRLRRWFRSRMAHADHAAR